MIKVCDMIMGSGKTTAAINKMNADKDGKYIFVTPFLDEADRIVKSCPAKKFVSPTYEHGAKLTDFHILLSKGRNIATTHSLFARSTPETLELIQDAGYKLILDEAFQVVDNFRCSKYILNYLKDKGAMEEDVETRSLTWIGNDEIDNDPSLARLREHCLSGRAYTCGGEAVVWIFPVDLFNVFQEVIILTYLFDAQLLRYYFDLNKTDYIKIGVEQRDDSYYFSDDCTPPDFVADLVDLVHIVDHKRLNAIGAGKSAMSSSWFDKEIRSKQCCKESNVDTLRKHLTNLFQCVTPAYSGEMLWTTYKKAERYVAAPKHKKAFLQLAARATNDYRNTNKLAYCANLHYEPLMKRFFKQFGIEMDDDGYALSMMIQWIWRSAIRDRKEIWVYIPSFRMRKLLEDWMMEQKRIIERKRLNENC